MLENQTEHTFIVTADADSLKNAQVSLIGLTILKTALFLNGMRKEDRKAEQRTDGLYYSRKISI